MKKLLYLLPLFILIYSCQKSITPGEMPEPSAGNPEQLHKVTFNVKDFTMETNAMNAQSNSLDGMDSTSDSYLKYLVCGIYYNPDYYLGDTAGTPVIPQTEQVFGNDNFGTFSAQLRKGYYTVVLAGLQHPYPYGDFGLGFASIKYGYFLWSPTPHNDVFVKTFNLTITDKDTLLDQIELKRVTGKLEIHFTDSVPSEVNKITTTIKNIPIRYNLIQDLLDPTPGTNTSFWYKTGISGYDQYDNIGAFCYGSDNKLEVTIQAYKTGDTLYAQKTIDDVYVYRNKKTILTGEFSSIPLVDQTGVIIKPGTISADSTFDQTITKNF